MARGESGRIVIEIEPEVKRHLYAALALSGSTLKDWFLKKATDYCEEAVQPSLFGRAGQPAGKVRSRSLTEQTANGPKSVAAQEPQPPEA